MISAAHKALISSKSVALPTSFKMEVTTTGLSEVVTIVCGDTGTYNATINWGDGDPDSTITTFNDADLAHTYAAIGSYDIEITGDFNWVRYHNSINANSITAILETPVGYANPLTTLKEAFEDANNLTSISADFDTSGVAEWSAAFKQCHSLTSFPNLDFSSATQLGSNWGEGAWNTCTGLTSFPLIVIPVVTKMSGAWRSCTGLTSFPVLDVSSCQIFDSTWFGCSGLTTFPAIDFSHLTGNLGNTWGACSGLTSFPAIDFGSCTSWYTCWQDCTGLTSFPLLTSTSSLTNVRQAWEDCTGLTSFPLIDFSNVSNFDSAWRRCTGLTSFPLIDFTGYTYLRYCWRECSGLTSFPLINTSSCSDFQETWNGCSSLTTFPLVDTSAGLSFIQTWRSCSSLTAFPACVFDAATRMDLTWNNCTNLATFPANMFDNTLNTNFTDAFSGCALTATSVNNILISIDAAGQSNGTLDLDGGTSAAPTGAGATAKAALITKGWTVTTN